MAKSTSPTVSVWCMRGGKITEITGCRLGKEMVTLPDGQRWSRNRGGTDGFYESELEAAQAFMKILPATLDVYRTRLSAYESLEADCKRVFEVRRREMHALSASRHGLLVADSMWGRVNDGPALTDSQAVGNG